MKTEYLTSALLVLCSCMAERLEQPLVLAGYDGSTGSDARLGTDAPGQDALPAPEDTTASDLSATDTTSDVRSSDTNDANSAESEITQDSSDVGSSDTNDAIPVGSDITQDSADDGPLDTNDANSVENEIAQDSSNVGSSDTNDAIPVGSDTNPDDGADTPVPSCGTCDDKNPCSKDECVAGSCQHTLLTGVACSDGNACTVNDGCATGKCSGMKAICDDGVACTKDACSPAAGCTVTADDKACDDGNPCTADKCGTKGCSHVSTGSACDDGSACTTKDTCVGLACAGTAVNCDDGNSCTKDTCVLQIGCSFSNSTGACQDGNACTADDVCKSGSCVAGKKLDCDDGNACTVDSCGLAGCAHKVASDGTACGAGAVCQDGACGALCGNGKLDAGEQCDDGNAKLCDGCENCEPRNVLQFNKGKTYSSSWLPSTQQATLETWMRMDKEPDMPNGEGNLFSWLIGNGQFTTQNSLHLFLRKPKNSQLELCGWIANNEYDCKPIAVKVGTWHHVAVTVSSNSISLFLDGKLLSTKPRPPSFVGANGAGTQLGHQGNAVGSEYWFHGALDEVRTSYTVRYTSDFVPVRRLVPDSHTEALWHLDVAPNGLSVNMELKSGTVLAADTCYGVPPDAAACGDGKKAIFEACDDGNTKDGDGCSATCTLP